MATVVAEAISLPPVPQDRCVGGGPNTKQPRLVFVSLLPISILRNLRQDDSCTGSVPWLTGVYNDMVEFTDHEGILCSFK